MKRWKRWVPLLPLLVLLLASTHVIGISFTGTVYEGKFGDMTQTVSGVMINLYCSNTYGVEGKFISLGEADRTGFYSLEGPDACEFYNILLTPPVGASAVGARSSSGEVLSSTWIMIPLSIARGNLLLPQNDFWIQTTISCPVGCECLSEAAAKQKFLSYDRCSSTICGYETQTIPQYCIRPVTVTTFEPANGIPCNDGNLCTIGDAYMNGICMSGAPLICDDQNPGTIDTCDPRQGCLYLPVGPADGDPCEDGNLCTINDVYQDGTCSAGTFLLCDDQNPNTTDTCDPAIGCIFLPIAVPSIIETVIPKQTTTQCLETYVESGSIKSDSKGALLCSVQIATRNQSGLLKLEQGTQALDAKGVPLGTISITRLGAEEIPFTSTLAPIRFSGYAYRCYPEGAEFDPPITLSLSLQEEEWKIISSMDPVFHWYNAQEARWEPLTTNVVAASRRIDATTNHFSIIALFLQVSPTESITSTIPTLSPSVNWKGTPISPLLPTTYAPALAIIIGFCALAIGTMIPSFGIYQRLQTFLDKITGYLKSEISALFSKWDIEKRKIVPSVRGAGYLNPRELVVILISAAVFGIAFVIKDKIAFQWITLFIFLLMGGLATIFHELSHRWVARRYGFRSEFQFWSLGALTMLFTAWIFGTVFANPSRTVMGGAESKPPMHEALVSGAGPLVNLLFAVISIPLVYFGGFFTIVGMAGFSMNLLSSVYSMIPIYPMDGRKIFSWNRYVWALIFMPIFVIFLLFFVI